MLANATYSCGERRSERAACLPVFSRGSREVAAPRGVERERLRDCLGRRGKRAGRREKRVGPRSVRLERTRESKAPLRSFGGLLGTRGGRLWLWKGAARGAGGEARRMAWAAPRLGRSAQRRVREDELGDRALHELRGGSAEPGRRLSWRARGGSTRARSG